MRGKQGELFGSFPLEYGGESSRGKRKVKRPFRRKHAIHATFRAARAVAGSGLSMLHPKHKGFVYLEAFRIAEESQVKLYRVVNVGNHIHILLKARSRAAFQRFLRVFAGRIAMLATGARKGQAKKFWTTSVHTKIIVWGKQFNRLSRYMEKNLREAEGARAAILAPGFLIYASG